MATTFVEYTGDGNATKQFTFPSYQSSDVKVRVDGVLKTASTHYNITSYTTTGGGNVVFTSGNIPSSPANIRIYRDTNVDTAKATFTAGSSVKAADLNNNNTQLLYRAQEEQIPNLIHSYDIDDDAIINALIADSQIDSEHYVDGSIDREHLAADIVDGTKIADDSINSEHYVDGSIDEQHLSNSAVSSTKIADNAVTTTEILNGAVTRAKLEADIIDGTKLADNAVDSEHYTDGSIDRVHLEADIIDSTKLADNAVNSEHYVDGSIDHVHLANDIIDGDNIQDDVVNSEHIAAGALDNEHYAAGSITSDKLNGATVITASEQGAATTNDTSFLTSAAADARFFNISSGDTIKDGQSFPDNDTTIATTAAINDRIIDLVDNVGGFVPIANENSFPNENPDINNGAGTLVSIQTLSGTRNSGGQGTASIANGALDGSNVDIIDCGSTELTAGFGLILETTTTLHRYKFHRLVPKATEVTTVAGISSNITTVANNTANINAVAADASDIGIVAADGTDIGLVAGSISNVNTTAGSIANVNTTAGSITNVNNVGNNISNVNSVAGNESNINSAVSNASNINSVVSNASNINTVAGSISNVNTTAGSISNVNTVASNISSVNNFFNVYRIGSSNPTSSLDTGDLFFNTTSNSLKVYTGSAWVDGVTATGNFAVTTGNTFTGSNVYNDNVKAIFGTGSDMEIFHYNGFGFITNTDGILHLRSVDGIKLQDQGGNEVFVNCIDNAAVELFYDNSKKLETISTGVLVTGKVAATGDLALTSSDGQKIRIGESNDLEIYHDGSHNYLKGNTGFTFVYGTSGVALHANSSDYALHAASNGATKLYYDGSQKLETTSTGLNITGVTVDDGATHDGDVTFKGNTSGTDLVWDKSHDNLKFNDSVYARFGTGSDLQIYHDGSNSIIDNTTGELRIQNDSTVRVMATNFNVVDENNSDTIINAASDGAVQLYYDNSKKLETNAFGAAITGNLSFVDNGIASFGNSGDLQIKHNGSHSYIEDTGTGDLILAASNIRFMNNAGTETTLQATPDGSVELYHNNSKKFETTSTGISVDGDIDGIPDGSKILVGTHDDLQLYHTSNASYIRASNHDLHLDSGTTNRIRIISGGSTTFGKMADFNTDGSVELYYDGSKKLETYSQGIALNGNATFPDGSFASFGASSDMEIYHIADNTNVIRGPGKLTIQSDDTTSGIKLSSYSGGETFAQFIKNGAVELYHDNSKKFETYSGGVRSHGELLMQSNHLYINDNAKLRIGSGQDLEIYHDGTDNYIRSNGLKNIYINPKDTDVGIKVIGDGAVELYYDNSKKFETNNGGVQVFGDLRIKDDENIYLGDGADLHISVGANNDGVINQANGDLKFQRAGSGKFTIKSDGTHFFDDVFPATNNTYNLGSTSLRWANVYTNDLNLSNEGSSNDVDGTWGDWTIQEGESDLFLKNNRSGKKYKFNLTEVS